MTIGSAASRPGYTPAAPLPTFRSFRRNGRLPVMPRIVTAGTPPRHLPKTAEADDPPRGRILVVEDQAPLALDVQRALLQAGYRAVGPVASVEEAERLIARGPIDGAVVDLQLNGGVATVVAESLAQEGIPLVWLTNAEAPLDAYPRAHMGAPAVTKPFTGDELIRTLERALRPWHRSGKQRPYPVPPPQSVWPRVFPQL